MKKLFLFAAAAAMITACSETDVLENSATLAESNEAPVTFDVYAQRNITRAGTPGTLDNNNIGKVGFGVFGYWTKGSEYNTNATPNFMYNQKVITSESPATGTSKWSYEPVKYWPNEFGSAAISDEVDMVTFFAYAPWTEIEPTTGEIIATEDKAVKNANGEDEGITETIDLIVSCDTLIVLVILIEIIRGQHEEILVCRTAILHIMIGQIILPSTNLSM
jgi:hypothetical protein